MSGEVVVGNNSATVVARAFARRFARQSTRSIPAAAAPAFNRLMCETARCGDSACGLDLRHAYALPGGNLLSRNVAEIFLTFARRADRLTLPENRTSSTQQDRVSISKDEPVPYTIISGINVERQWELLSWANERRKC